MRSKLTKEVQAYLRELGLRISELRAVSGLTQDKLAERAKMTLEHLQRCERGTQNLKFETFLRIAAALKFDPIHLLAKPGLSERPVGRPPKRQTTDEPPKKMRRRRKTTNG